MIFQRYKAGDLVVVKDNVSGGARNPNSLTGEDLKRMGWEEYKKGVNETSNLYGIVVSIVKPFFINGSKYMVQVKFPELGENHQIGIGNNSKNLRKAYFWERRDKSKFPKDITDLLKTEIFGVNENRPIYEGEKRLISTQ